jgi:hypothetical protein
VFPIARDRLRHGRRLAGVGDEVVADVVEYAPDLVLECIAGVASLSASTDGRGPRRVDSGA